jgi:hypothetical protein
MRRTVELETLPSALHVPPREATHVALGAPPPTEPAALANDADVTLDAGNGAGAAASVAGEAGGTSAHTLTLAAGFPMSWSELDEWLDAS